MTGRIFLIEFFSFNILNILPHSPGLWSVYWEICQYSLGGFPVCDKSLLFCCFQNSFFVFDFWQFNYNVSWCSTFPVQPVWSPLGFPGGLDGKESACNVGDLDSVSGLGRYPGEGNWLPTPVFWPGEFHGQRSLVHYSPWGRRDLDMTGWLLLTFFRLHEFGYLFFFPSSRSF